MDIERIDWWAEESTKKQTFILIDGKKVFNPTGEQISQADAAYTTEYLTKEQIKEKYGK